MVSAACERRVLSTADGNGPVLTAITSTPGSSSLVLTFDGPLLSSTATDLTNYRVTAPNGGNPEVVTSSGPSLRVVAAQYGDISPTSSQVTLTLARPLQPTTFYRIFINGELPITNGNPASNPLTGGGAAGNPSNGKTFDGDNDDTAGGNFYGLFAMGRRLTFTDFSGDRVVVAASGGGLNVWRELNGDIDQITVLPGATALHAEHHPCQRSRHHPPARHPVWRLRAGAALGRLSQRSVARVRRPHHGRLQQNLHDLRHADGAQHQGADRGGHPWRRRGRAGQDSPAVGFAGGGVGRGHGGP